MNELTELLEFVKENNGVKTVDGPGRGHKQCPECKAYVGVRSRICACGLNFSENPKKPSLESEYPVEMVAFCQSFGLPPNRVCFTPSGPFTTKLKSLDYNDVVLFCDDVVDEYYNSNHRVLTPGAIKYVGRNHLDLEGDSLDWFSLCVDEWFSTISCEIGADDEVA